MNAEQNEVHSETDAARAGSTPHIVRWVLGISLFAAIVLLSIIWMTGAATQGDGEDEANVSQMIRDAEQAENDRRDIDGIVNQNADEFAPETPADMPGPDDPNPARTIPN